MRYCSYTTFKDPNYYSTSDPNVLSQKITNSVWVAHVNPYFYTLKQFLSNNAFELIGIAYNEDNHTLAYEAACNKYGKEYIDSLPLE